MIYGGFKGFRTNSQVPLTSKVGTNLASGKVLVAAIAQLVEHLICNQRVGSSSLSGGTTFLQHKQYDSDLSPETPVYGLHQEIHRGYTISRLSSI